MRVEWERADLCGLTVGGWVEGQPDSASGSGTSPFCSGVTCVWSGRGQISVVWQWVGGGSAWQCFWLGYWSFLQWSDMRVEWERADLCGLTVGGWMVSLTVLLARVLVLSAVEWPACGVGEGRSLWSDSGWVEGQPDSASGSGTSPFCSGVTCVWSGRGQISVVLQWVDGWMVSLTALLARVLVLSAVEWHACEVGEGRSLWSDSGWVDGQPDSASGSGTSPFCSGVTCVWSGRGQISVVLQWVGGWSAWPRFWLGY